MSEQRMDQQTVMYVLIGVVVVLVGIFGYMVYARSQPDAGIPAASPAGIAQNSATPADPNAATGATPSQTAPAASTAVADPKTSTKMVGADPKAHVTTYYNAVVKGDWKTAYALLPTTTRAQLGTVQQYGQAQQGYGIKSYKVTGVQATGDKTVVTVSMQASSIAFSNAWTFSKAGGVWYAVDKKTALNQ
jgi:hypothetical protein